jgi:glutamate synthase domain-containing protein 3
VQRLVVSPRASRLRDGALVLRASCQSTAGAGACVGRIVVRAPASSDAAAVIYGHAPIRIRANRGSHIVLTLTQAARRRLRGNKKLAVVVEVTLTVAGGSSTTDTALLTLIIG